MQADFLLPRIIPPYKFRLTIFLVLFWIAMTFVAFNQAGAFEEAEKASPASPASVVAPKSWVEPEPVPMPPPVGLYPRPSAMPVETT